MALNPQKHRAINGKEIFLILLLIPLLVGGGMAWTEKSGEQERLIGKYIFFIALPFALIIGVSYFFDRLQYLRKDIFPDVLSSMASLGEIRQTGDMHFIYTGKHGGDCIELRFVFQNLFDSENRVRLRLKPRFGADQLAYEIPWLDEVIPAGAVIEARTVLPLRKFNSGVEFEIIAFSKARRGQRVRFAHREALSFTTHPALALILVLRTHAHAPDSATLFTVYPRTDVRPLNETNPAEPEWFINSIWLPSTFV